MTSPAFSIECSNSACFNSENRFGQRLCRGCRKPLAYQYLWATGEGARQVAPGTVIGDRYVVMSPQVWLDRTPGRSPLFSSSTIPAVARPYLSLFDQHIHIPQVYDIYTALSPAQPILLLENGPIDPGGKPYITLQSAWSKATAVRQAYWLWQMLQLWAPLKKAGVATSVLNPDNLYVEGWRVQLRELTSDAIAPTEPTLADLAELWLPWTDTAQPTVGQPLREVCLMMQKMAVGRRVPVGAGVSAGERSAASADCPMAIAQQLNRILLEQASQLPLNLKIAGATTTGPQCAHNEDACYPNTLSGNDTTLPDDLLLMPRLAIVCDGIGGHSGGEVASQLAVRSLKLQICALLTELAEQAELLTPDLIAQQLEAIVRVTNNLITSQNNEQGRTARQRMCTTLAMGLQLPQHVLSPGGISNGHELYVVNVGDSRAYWITARYCHRLTVDDDVASREVRQGRSLYRQAPTVPNAEALTQALGTKDGSLLTPHVQRFVVEEDGILLLCSDGLSDYGWVEAMWEHSSKLVLHGKMSLEAAVRSWLELANQRNGEDNTSVVMMLCQVGAPQPELLNFSEVGSGSSWETLGDRTSDVDFDELSDASKALLYGDELTTEGDAQSTPSTRSLSKAWLIILMITLIGFITGGAGLLAWRFISPTSFENTVEQLR